jgi:hypothetical protein
MRTGRRVFDYDLTDKAIAKHLRGSTLVAGNAAKQLSISEQPRIFMRANE